MATNIQMNLYNGSSYEVLYPQTTASQAGARPSTWTPTASDVGALPISGGTLTGNLTLKSSGNYGTSINWGDGDYVHISEPTDDCMEVKAKKVNFVLSDSSDSKFTINDVNPFGSSNSDSNIICEKIVKQGTNTALNTEQTLFTLSKITELLSIYYVTANIQSGYMSFSLQSNNSSSIPNFTAFTYGFLYNFNNNFCAQDFLDPNSNKNKITVTLKYSINKQLTIKKTYDIKVGDESIFYSYGNDNSYKYNYYAIGY